MNQDEFFPNASEWPTNLSRRRFLEMATASLALAGVTSCTRLPLEKIVPYAKTPEDLIPGKPLFYSTSYVHTGIAHGLLVESHEGRPTKIEGHPLHPSNLGAATAQQQAFILSLYDPDRSQRVSFKNKNSSWEEMKKNILALLPQLQNNRGQGLYFMTEWTSSAVVRSQFEKLKNIFPEMKWIQYEAHTHFENLKATEKVFGKSLQPVYDLSQAQTMVCLDADFMGSPLYPLRYAHDFITRRRDLEKNAADKNKLLPQLFVAETTPSLTGVWSANRVGATPREILELAEALYARLEKKGETRNLKPEHVQFIDKIISAMKMDSTAFFVGENAHPLVHEIGHHLNSRYGAKTIRYRDCNLPLDDSPLTKLQDLALDLNNGKVEALFIYGANPVYNSPALMEFSKALSKAKNSFHFSLLEDETSWACQWRAPSTHPLESWSDAEDFQGNFCLIQPLIAPLFEGKELPSVLSILSGKEATAYDILRDYLSKEKPTDFETYWSQALRQGIIFNDKTTAKAPASRLHDVKLPPAMTAPSGTIEIIFKPDACIADGRFANNPWLQELPKPLTQLTWENAALIGPELAKKYSLKNEQHIKISTPTGDLTVPVWIIQGQPEGIITLSFGYGRTRGGKVCGENGYNAYKLWNPKEPQSYFATINVLTKKSQLASTQTHHNLNYQEATGVLKAQPSLYPQAPVPLATEAWAMVIDLDSCIGCSACMVACQSENNIPVVGKEGVLQGREMHWIRVDRYFTDDQSKSQFTFLPVPCMHCEKAPCEPVCPVGATTHSTDGLNQMVYNRCIGTRYCSNNCPYKVRRFNFFALNSNLTEIEKMQKNPNVSVRSRGVMEKCTYCVQRIQSGRIAAKKELRAIADGEIKTACQATCPTQAISFGNKNDVHSKVNELRQNPRHFVLLEELGTLPRTTYLAKIKQDQNHG